MDKTARVMRVQRADQWDLSELLVVDPRAAAGDAERRAYLAQAVEHEICFVATDGDGARGFVVVKAKHFFDRDFIDLLMVAADHRRQGIGRMLMRTAVEAATSVDVFTSTNESNVPMQALLESEGWSFSGRLDGLDEGDPELVYHLPGPAARPSSSPVVIGF